jgi:elongation factor G
MDKAGADAVYATSTIVDRLGARAVPINIQIGAEAKFLGVIDLVTMKAILWHDETMGAEYSVEEIPADLLETAKEARHTLIEAVAENDDELMHLYLEGQEPSEAQLKAGIRKATIAMKIFPVLCGSSFKNKGVQTLLDAVVDYLPSPLDIPSIIGHNPDNMEEEVVRHADDNEPLRRSASRL